MEEEEGEEREAQESVKDSLKDVVVGAIVPLPVKMGGGGAVDWAVLQVGCGRTEENLSCLPHIYISVV
jgi:hypothetical protein